MKFSRRKRITLFVGWLLVYLLAALVLALTDDVGAQGQPEAAVSAYCEMWTPHIQWQISPVAGSITTGYNGRWERDEGDQVRIGSTVYGEAVWTAMVIVGSAEIYEDGELVHQELFYIDCEQFDFEAKGNIEVVDAVRVNDGVKLTFLINPLPEYIAAGPLTVSGIADGVPFYSLQAAVDRRVGLWSFFTATIPGPVGSLAVTTADAWMDARYFGFQNPGAVRIRTPYSIFLPFVAR